MCAFSRAGRSPQISHVPPDRRSTSWTTSRGMCRLRPFDFRRFGASLRCGSLRSSHSSTSCPRAWLSVKDFPFDISSRTRRSPSIVFFVAMSRSRNVGSPCRASSIAFSARSRNSFGASRCAASSQSSFRSASAGSRRTRPSCTAVSGTTEPSRTIASSSGVRRSARPSSSSRRASCGPYPASAANR